MSPEPTAALRASLDRRLVVARAAAIDRAPAVEPDEPKPSDGGTTPRATVGPAVDASAFAARWPAGSLVSARVTARDGAGDAGRLVLDVDGLAIEVASHAAARAAVGDVLAFRVLAHAPRLVLQRAAVPSPDADFDGTTTDISRDAQALHAASALADHGAAGDRTVRFSTPLVHAHDVLSRETRAAVIAHETAGIDHGDARTPLQRPGSDGAPPFSPVVLAGPAWHAAPLELVVRQQRRDDALDDPAHDDWCGELVIDLPRLGRVAAHVAWSMQGLRVRIDADRDDGAATLADAVPALAAAFGEAGLRVGALSIAQAIHSGGRDG